MKISVITLFPNIVSSFINESIIKRAVKKKHISISIVNLRDFALDKYGTVDDRPYGGGAGMVLMIKPIDRALKSIGVSKKESSAHVVLTSPKGKKYNQTLAFQYSRLKHLVIIAGHYEGVDARVCSYINEEVSVGDFVLTSGELASAIILDSTARLVPGVLGNKNSGREESFMRVPIDKLEYALGQNSAFIKKAKKRNIKSVLLLEYPQYTRPEIYADKRVPPILISGNHEKIEKWRLKQAFNITRDRRPDLLE